jgi:uncharacterized linocin/CFP29 family protein
MYLGRDKLTWNQDIWNRIDKAVHDEAMRTKIAAKFIPLYITASDALSVPRDTIDTSDPQTLTVDEGTTFSLFEISVGFSLTQQQVENEGGLMTAVTLATRATNFLSQAEDILIFQGDDGIKNTDLFKTKRVRRRNGSFGEGLVKVAEDQRQSKPSHVIPVPLNPNAPTPNGYGENTFTAVSQAYSRLQDLGHYGPYALVLHDAVYADTYAPLKTTLIMPADRIRPLVTAGFYGTGTLPAFTGLLMSLGGNSMDLAVGVDATTAFLQEDTNRLDQFNVFERFTLRLKDKTAIIKLEFEHQSP